MSIVFYQVKKGPVPALRYLLKAISFPTMAFAIEAASTYTSNPAVGIPMRHSGVAVVEHKSYF